MISSLSNITCIELAPRSWQDPAKALENGVIGKLLEPPSRTGELTENPCEFNRWMQHHLIEIILFLEVVFMRLGRRYGLSAVQKTEIWRRWKAGESLHEIGRALGKDHGSIHFLLSQHGGIVPAVRRRSARTLTLAEREEISRGIASGSSIREIAKKLQRAASTGQPGGGAPRRASTVSSQ